MMSERNSRLHVRGAFVQDGRRSQLERASRAEPLEVHAQ
jgi:hypothetical protein